jgi:transcription elongation GreA/GreB family factor
MGKRVGDTAVAQTPAGELRFKILEIRPRAG